MSLLFLFVLVFFSQDQWLTLIWGARSLFLFLLSKCVFVIAVLYCLKQIMQQYSINYSSSYSFFFFFNIHMHTYVHTCMYTHTYLFCGYESKQKKVSYLCNLFLLCCRYPNRWYLHQTGNYWRRFRKPLLRKNFTGTFFEKCLLLGRDSRNFLQNTHIFCHHCFIFRKLKSFRKLYSFWVRFRF